MVSSNLRLLQLQENGLRLTLQRLLAPTADLDFMR